MIRFLVEVSKRLDITVLPTPSNEHANTAVNGTGIIYEIDIGEHPTESFWLDWGGHFDSFVGTQIMLYYEGFLSRVNSLDDLRETANSMFIQGRKVFINLPKHPWLYSDYSTSFMEVASFLSSALDPCNPSNNLLRKGSAEKPGFKVKIWPEDENRETRPESDRIIKASFDQNAPAVTERAAASFASALGLGSPLNVAETVSAQVRLEVPSFTVKLSDNISGITLHQGFSISLHNNDGYFDNDDDWNMFNTPVYLKKAVKENPMYEDFKLIRDGLVENKKTTFDRMQIDVADRFKALEEPVCRVIRQEDFYFEVESNALGRQIPIVFGRVRIRLIRLDRTRYMTAENATDIRSVVDRNRRPIDNATFDQVTKILTVPNADTEGGDDGYGIEAYEALVIGTTGPDITDNTIGCIIQALTARANIVFNETNFNTAEFNSYASSSFPINIAITSGNVRRAIEAVLRNDMAFFIQQTDGRFTIRRYGETYATHIIPAWAITRKPEKDYGRAQDNYFSSCIINYVDNEAQHLNVLFNERENEAERKYRRIVQKTFDTNLTNEAYALQLAALLSNRYSFMRQTVKLAMGIDTTKFELLDKVTVDLTINGRKFSNATDYIIKEINHAQDILVLEEIEKIEEDEDEKEV